MAGVFTMCKAMMTHAQEQQRHFDVFDCLDEGVRQMVFAIRVHAARREQLGPGIVSVNIPVMQTELELMRAKWSQGWSEGYDREQGPYYQREFNTVDEAKACRYICIAMMHGNDFIENTQALGAAAEFTMGDAQRLWNKLGRDESKFVRMPKNIMDSLCQLDQIELSGPELDRAS